MAMLRNAGAKLSGCLLVFAKVTPDRHPVSNLQTKPDFVINF